MLTTTIVLRPFVRDYPGEPVPEETLTHPPSWSSSNLYQLLPSTTIHSILVQITCLAIFLHNFFPRPLWSTSWSGALHLIVHTFLHSVSIFRSTCPYHRNLFCCSVNIISSIPSLSLNSLLGTLSFTLTLHIRLTILISARWSATSFSFLTGQEQKVWGWVSQVVLQAGCPSCPPTSSVKAQKKILLVTSYNRYSDTNSTQLLFHANRKSYAIFLPNGDIANDASS